MTEINNHGSILTYQYRYPLTTDQELSRPQLNLHVCTLSTMHPNGILERWLDQTKTAIPLIDSGVSLE